MIVGYVQGGRFEEALACFSRMQTTNMSPNKSTIVSVLSTCGPLGSLELGKLIGSRVSDHGLGSNIHSLICIVSVVKLIWIMSYMMG